MSEEMEDKLARKRQNVTGPDPSVKTKKALINFSLMALTLVVTIIGAYIFFGQVPAEPPSRYTGGDGITMANTSIKGEVRHLVSSLGTDRASFFDYTTADNIKMRYFLIKTKDGFVRSAFDACDACWRSGKGYKQDGDVMVCNNCRMRFPLNKIGDVKGGCNPSPLEKTVDGDVVVIKTGDIEKQKKYFDLEN